jgi:hypothetical protein
LRQKPVQIGLARFFRFWLGFLGFGSVFSSIGSVSILAQFFWFGSVFFPFFSVSIRFGFFSFLLIKPNRTSLFFQKFNRFFFGSVFSIFFFGFLGLIGFSVFLLTPN